MIAADSAVAIPLITVPTLRKMKADGELIAAATAYDASFGAALDRCGVDLVLVGDSLGMVVQGHANTLRVDLEQMIYHCAATARGVRRALLVADMPFASYPEPSVAFRNAARLLAEGQASMVKLEGDGPVLESIRYLSEREIPVCAHIGMTPQSVLRFGGFRVQGRNESAAARIRDAAVAVEQAGAEILVLECVPSTLAAELRALVSIPVIGIGAGVNCDGQILVSYDLLGLSVGRRPRFVKNFLQGRGSIDEAIQAFVADVRSGAFPAPEHSY